MYNSSPLTSEVRVEDFVRLCWQVWVRKIFSSIKTRLYLRTTQHFIQEIGLKKGEVRGSGQKVLVLGIIVMHPGSSKDLDFMCHNYIRCYTYSIQMYKINVILFLFNTVYTYISYIWPRKLDRIIADPKDNWYRLA
jgi:hypothetical protein